MILFKMLNWKRKFLMHVFYFSHIGCEIFLFHLGYLIVSLVIQLNQIPVCVKTIQEVSSELAQLTEKTQILRYKKNSQSHITIICLIFSLVEIKMTKKYAINMVISFTVIDLHLVNGSENQFYKSINTQ